MIGALEFERKKTRNAILGALEPQEEARLAPHLRARSFDQGQLVAALGQVPDQVHFLEGGMLSNVCSSNQNVTLSVGMVGREGVCDALLALNGLPHIDHVLVHASGWGWSLPAPILRQEFARGGALQGNVLCYFDLHCSQVTLANLCNRLHTLEERLARWLLAMRSAYESDEFPLPSSIVACMLGSRPSSVPIALGVLQRAGLIGIESQAVCILDVPAIEAAACECHALLAERLKIYHSHRRGHSDTPREVYADQALAASVAPLV